MTFHSTHRKLHSISKKFGESYQNTKDTNKFSLLRLKIVTILYNKCLTTFLQLPETISKSLLWNQSQNGCHMIFDGIHICKMCTFSGHLQAGNQEEVHRSQIREVRRVIKHSYHLLRQELVHMCRGIILEQHLFSSPVQLWPNPSVSCSNWFKTAW